MQHIVRKLVVLIFFGSLSVCAYAKMILASPSTYTGYLSTLAAGDTLMLSSGNYTGNLTLSGRNGTALQPIVIMGEGQGTIFLGQSCCNTISITQCSYLVIKKLLLNGNNLLIDGVKAEGTSGNYAHHITLEYLTLINYGASQQNVGISTKCSAWNWTIRKNKIIGAGTGMYLGNSAGDKPFVNGIIEYNYIANTLGYNIEIKHQFDTVRDDFPGTSIDGKTLIRYNVFTKDVSSSTGGNARPNVLVGGFPLTGWGSKDYYEIYGNFFYNNPVEALFQGTGNIQLYQNIFVNHFDPNGFRAVYLAPQNGVNPQDIKVFHNSVWTLNSSGGIRLYNPNTTYKQYCYSNAVFSPLPITNFIDSLNNITDSYLNASNYVLSASVNLNNINLYPQAGQLTGAITPSILFQNNSSSDLDFNKDPYNWTYRGAYSGCCVNKGWKLQLDTMYEPKSTTSMIEIIEESELLIYPNPFVIEINILFKGDKQSEVEIFDASGNKVIMTSMNSEYTKLNLSDLNPGLYCLKITYEGKVFSRKIRKD